MINLEKSTKRFVILILSLWIFGEIIFWPFVRHTIETQGEETKKRINQLASEIDNKISRQSKVSMTINFNPLAKMDLRIQKLMETVDIKYNIKEDIFSILANSYSRKDFGEIRIYNLPFFINQGFIRIWMPKFAEVPYEYTIEIANQDIVTLSMDSKQTELDNFSKWFNEQRRKSNDLRRALPLKGETVLEKLEDSSYAVPLRLFFDTEALCSLNTTVQSLGYIEVGFRWKGQEYSKKQSFIATIHPKAICPIFLDNDKMYAAYVNPLNSEIKQFGNELLKMTGETVYDNKLKIAQILFYAIKTSGMIYAYSSSGPIYFSHRLQTPEETLQYSSGQCSDLSILFANLYEAYSIPTYFVFLPGHVFILFEVDNDDLPKISRQLRRYLINYEGKKVLPLETTDIYSESSFLDAVGQGYTQYNQNINRKVIDIENTWDEYPPLPCRWASKKLKAPKKSALIKEINKFANDDGF